jgi:hypothetical protein
MNNETNGYKTKDSRDEIIRRIAGYRGNESTSEELQIDPVERNCRSINTYVEIVLAGWKILDNQNNSLTIDLQVEGFGRTLKNNRRIKSSGGNRSFIGLTL